MNQAHLEILASTGWRDTLRAEILPRALEAVELGDDVLELAPGPGLTTPSALLARKP
jgi:hypothetical protein